MTCCLLLKNFVSLDLLFSIKSIEFLHYVIHKFGVSPLLNGQLQVKINCLKHLDCVVDAVLCLNQNQRADVTLNWTIYTHLTSFRLAYHFISNTLVVYKCTIMRFGNTLLVQKIKLQNYQIPDNNFYKDTKWLFLKQCSYLKVNFNVATQSCVLVVEFNKLLQQTGLGSAIV